MASSKRNKRSINMDPDNLDPNYRYKMEQIMIRNQGKNTGQTTIILNILQIADDIIGTKIEENKNGRYSKDIIQLTAKHLVQFIGKKIAGQCKYNKVTKVAICNGIHQQHKLQNIIFQYVKQFAFCPQCKLPELTPVVIKKSTIKCKACDYVKNHKKDKNNKNNKRDKKHKKKKKKKKKKFEDDNIDKHNDDEVKENDDNDDNDPNDPIFCLNAFLAKNENVSSDEIMEKIKILSLAHKLDRKEQIKMVIECLAKFDDNNYKSLINSIQEYSAIFETFTLTNNDTQIFLAYIEELIMHKSFGVDLLNHSYKIFYTLYDQDIIDEDEINEWYQSVHNKYSVINKMEAQLIRQKTAPFIKGLNNTPSQD